MSTDQIEELLREMIPQIEAEIHKQLRNQYEKRLKQIEVNYEREVERLIKLKQQQIRRVYESKLDSENSDAYKKIAILEAQRKDWVQMEIAYQKTIKQLTNKIMVVEQRKRTPEESKSSFFSEENNNSLNTSLDKSSIYEFEKSEMIAPPPSAELEEKVSKWKKKPEVNELNKYFEMPKKVEMKRQQGSLQEVKEKDYESILGPPKTESVRKESSEVKKSSNMFWNEDKKKELLKMIKLK